MTVTVQTLQEIRWNRPNDRRDGSSSVSWEQTIWHWVYKFTWQRVGLGRVSYLVGWVWLGRWK